MSKQAYTTDSKKKSLMTPQERFVNDVKHFIHSTHYAMDNKITYNSDEDKEVIEIDGKNGDWVRLTLRTS